MLPMDSLMLGVNPEEKSRGLATGLLSIVKLFGKHQRVAYGHLDARGSHDAKDSGVAYKI